MATTAEEREAFNQLVRSEVTNITDLITGDHEIQPDDNDDHEYDVAIKTATAIAGGEALAAQIPAILSDFRIRSRKTRIASSIAKPTDPDEERLKFFDRCLVGTEEDTSQGDPIRTPVPGPPVPPDLSNWTRDPPPRPPIVVPAESFWGVVPLPLTASARVPALPVRPPLSSSPSPPVSLSSQRQAQPGRLPIVDVRGQKAATMANDDNKRSDDPDLADLTNVLQRTHVAPPADTRGKLGVHRRTRSEIRVLDTVWPTTTKTDLEISIMLECLMMREPERLKHLVALDGGTLKLSPLPTAGTVCETLRVMRDNIRAVRARNTTAEGLLPGVFEISMVLYRLATLTTQILDITDKWKTFDLSVSEILSVFSPLTEIAHLLVYTPCSPILLQRVVTEAHALAARAALARPSPSEPTEVAFGYAINLFKGQPLNPSQEGFVRRILDTEFPIPDHLVQAVIFIEWMAEPVRERLDVCKLDDIV